jgi:hypothetical protein
MDYFKVPYEHLPGETDQLNLGLTNMKEQEISMLKF